MKILFLLSRIDRTGMTTNALDLGEEFVKNGHQVHVITSDVAPDEQTELDFIRNRFINSGMHLHFFPCKKGRFILESFWVRLNISWFCILKIFQLHPDIVHAISPYMTIIPWLLRKKYIWTVHVCDLERRVRLRPSSLVISISNESSDYAVQQFHYDAAAVRKVLHGVDPRFAIPSLETDRLAFLNAMGLSPSKKIIGAVCSFEYRKGLDILLNAVGLLPIKIRDGVEILIVGSEKYPGEEKQLLDLIVTLGLEKQVFICPHCDPKVAYDVMDVFVLPSRLEGFGLVVIEAMLSQCCTIRSNTQGASDQIEHGKTGLIFENENMAQLSSQLFEVLSNAELCCQISKYGYDFAKDHFLRKHMCQNTLKVYYEVIH